MSDTKSVHSTPCRQNPLSSVLCLLDWVFPSPQTPSLLVCHTHACRLAHTHFFTQSHLHNHIHKYTHIETHVCRPTHFYFPYERKSRTRGVELKMVSRAHFCRVLPSGSPGFLESKKKINSKLPLASQLTKIPRMPLQRSHLGETILLLPSHTASLLTVCVFPVSSFAMPLFVDTLSCSLVALEEWC